MLYKIYIIYGQSRLSNFDTDTFKTKLFYMTFRQFFMVSPRFRDFKLYFQETSIKELIMI